MDPLALPPSSRELPAVGAARAQRVFLLRIRAEQRRTSMKVASGLEFAAGGRDRNVGQTKGAYARAVAEGTAGRVLNRLFQKSFRAAKWARSATGISRGQVSVGNVAVDLAERIFGELSQARVLVLGARGRWAKGVQAMRSRGAEK